MDRQSLTDVNGKMVDKSEDCSKSTSSFCNIGFFLPTSIIDASFEVPASSIARTVFEKLAGKGHNMTGAKMTKMMKFEKITKLTSDMLVVQLFFNICLHPTKT